MGTSVDTMRTMAQVDADHGVRGLSAGSDAVRLKSLHENLATAGNLPAVRCPASSITSNYDFAGRFIWQEVGCAAMKVSTF